MPPEHQPNTPERSNLRFTWIRSHRRAPGQLRRWASLNLHDMCRTLSSAQTFVMKYVFPIVWIGGFGLGTLGMWLGDFHDSDGEPPPSWMRWQFLIMWIAGAAFIIWFANRVKRVRVDDQSLYVSNYFSEALIPLTEVADITENRNVRPSTITIHFRGPTAAGMSVVFIPRTRRFSQRSHPVIAELRARCERARQHIG